MRRWKRIEVTADKWKSLWNVFHRPAQMPSLLECLLLSLQPRPQLYTHVGDPVHIDGTVSGTPWSCGSGDSSLLVVFMVLEVFLTTVFTLCLTSYIKVLFPLLGDEFLEGRESAFCICVSCWTSAKWLLNGRTSCLLVYWIWTSVTWALSAILFLPLCSLPLCSPCIFPASSRGRRLLLGWPLSSYYGQGHHSIH